jgi:anti-anti-sigma regulatory factor
MKINVRTCGAVDVLSVSGPVTAGGPAKLRVALEPWLNCEDSFLVLNLSGVTGAGSGFLGELVACREHVRKHGGRIALVAGPRLSTLLSEARLDALFDVFPDEDGALDSFSPVAETAGIP